MVRIVPVLEGPQVPKSFWLPLPSEPWPSWIELRGDASSADVALAVLQLCSSGHRNGSPIDSEELAKSFPKIASGGLAVIGESITIGPSCCCGLEGWRDWFAVLTDGSSPWLGHDPSPWIESTDHGYTAWSDGGMSHHDPSTTPHVRLSRHDMEVGLAAVEPMLTHFAGRLLTVLSEARVPSAALIVERFRATFIATSDS